MYIEKVIIEGFKSYKNKTVVKFAPGVNVIVGQNGSGKTNLLYAIQFVLGNDIQDLSRKQRKAFLHVSSGLRSITAYVEIVFNNEDRRFSENSDEVRIRREITSQSEEFFINGVKMKRENVFLTLQSAGLSKTNPYYIIQQGKINNLSAASDEKRLSLLSEVSGLSLWEELHAENIAHLEDAEKEINSFQSSLERFQENVNDLKSASDVCLKLEGLNSKKRVLEYLHCKKEHTLVLAKLSEANKEHENAQLQEKNTSAALERIQKEKDDFKLVIEMNMNEKKSIEKRLRSLVEMVEELTLEHSKLQLEITDRMKHSLVDEVSLKNELKLIEDEISLNRRQLAEVTKRYNETIGEEQDINTRMLLKEQLKNQILTKLGRTAAFTSVEERNEWIVREIRKIQKLLDQQTNHFNALSIDITTEEDKAKCIGVEIESLETEKITNSDSAQKLYSEKKNYEVEQRRLQMLKNELWREENDASERKTEASKIRVNALEKLRRVVSRNILEGMLNIDRVLEKMREQGEGSYAFEMASAYRGLFIDQFSCDPGCYPAIDAAAGKKLFHHIVESDKAATEILRFHNELKLPGDFFFYAKNRLLRKTTDVTAEFSMPMLNMLQIQSGMEVVMEQVFGNVLLCSDFDVAIGVTRKHNVNAVTISGDLVSCNGPMSGGYCSPNRSKYQTYYEYVKATKAESAQISILEEIRNKIKAVDCEFNENSSILQRLNVKINSSKYLSIEEDLKKHRSDLTLTIQALEGKRALARKLSTSLEANRMKIEALVDELEQDFSSSLSLEENTELHFISEEILRLEKTLDNISAQRIELEIEKNSLQSKLDDHLLKKKSDLENTLQEIATSDLGSQQINLRAIGDMEAYLQQIEARVSSCKQETTILEEKIEELSVEVAKAQTDFDRRNCQEQRHQLQLDKQIEIVKQTLFAVERYSALEGNLTARIQILGTRFEQREKEYYNRYSSHSTKQLEATIAKVSQQLKTYEPVDRDAHVQYLSKRDKLKEMQKELNKFKVNRLKCQELVESVEQRKNVSLTRSLNQVAQSFKLMFKRLVPSSGAGRLRWIFDRSNSDREEDDDEILPSDIKHLKGIAVEVSFTSDVEVENVRSLSGGQKSLVSLSLVFAILTMDRAPFYLFDEADMALDAVRRANVAALVNDLAKGSQFIITTLRPEMLKFADNIIGVTYHRTMESSSASSVSEEVAFDFLNTGSQTESSNPSVASSQF